MSQPRDEATLAQIRAADPDRSTWLTANAGSGKTRVLTDRVARLLLGGADPARILCLTYTKAAAAEMEVRLLDRLGTWAMLPEARLRAQLAELGAEAPDHAALTRARRLFARAIETPGGLKIQTIHAFCAGLLRRFPLEAGVPHQFTEMDDRAAMILRADILEAMATGPDRDALDGLARLHGGDEIGRFLANIAAHASAFADGFDRDRMLADLGLPQGFTQAALLDEVFDGNEADLFTALIPHLHRSGAMDNKLADALAGLGKGPFGLAALGVLENQFLTSAGAKAGDFVAKIDIDRPTPTGKLRAALPPDVLDALNTLMLRVQDTRPRRIALAATERTAALHRFAVAFLRHYNAAKTARGWLDFDDLITRTGRLLSAPSVADWVLFRLDGGIDHILVDEAQDTSPGQWTVIDRLTGEFTSGQGARRGRPTLFVVGDLKQSIYSFQGADLEEFGRRRAQFLTAFEGIGNPMQELSLAHSFRSSAAILNAVDATFQPPHDAGLGGVPRHIAFHGDRPGRVDLWPVFAEEPAPEPEDYDAPVDLPAPAHPAMRLAQAIAARIRAMIDGGECVTPKSAAPRPIHEGDIIILVQRRSDLFGAVIGACKQAGLAVAGADRVKLAAEMAVGDIRATLSFLATPEDDLSLAEALRSPLFGWSESELYQLAQPRKGYLWEALRDQPDSPTVAALKDLRNRADFLRPYELMERLLTRHRGRERLLARLGPEAEDGIDVLLAQAMAYEMTEVPSLTGFLVWLAAGDLEVKRLTESGAGAIRVMTVHGAKGLEAPIVFLPDCAVRGANHQGKQLLLPPGGTALWRGTKDERPGDFAALITEEETRAEREKARLLYVAMTRAESWLIVAAAGKTDAPCWYLDAERGLQATGFTEVTDEPGADALPGPIRRHAHGDWPAATGSCHSGHPPPAPVQLPDWALTRPHAAPRPPAPVTATGLGGAKVMPGDPAELGASETGAADATAGAELLARQARDRAMAQGSALHLLLEHWPGADPADWPAIAERLGITDPALLASAERVLALDGIDPPGATVLREVELTAPPLWPGTGPFRGTIDRLSITPGRLRVTDYKSNAAIPERPEDTPGGILRQMAAYRAALALIYPGRTIECCILWTADATLMALPEDALQRAFDAASPAAGRLDGA